MYTSGELWICKPTGANQVRGDPSRYLLITGSVVQGKGIFLVRDLQQVLERLESDQRHCRIASRPTARIAQR